MQKNKYMFLKFPLKMYQGNICSFSRGSTQAMRKLKGELGTNRWIYEHLGLKHVLKISYIKTC